MKAVKIIKRSVTVLLVGILVLLIGVLITNTVALSKNQLSSFFGYTISYVPTESMEPTIRAGETVLIKKGGFEKTQVGDIIVYKNNEENKYIIHRVTRILEDGTLRVKGDNEYTNPSEDNVIITKDNYYGEYVSTVNFLNLKSLVKNKSFILPICILIYLIAVVSEGISIAKRIKAKNEEKLKALNNTKSMDDIKAELLEEIKAELMEENNK